MPALARKTQIMDAGPDQPIEMDRKRIVVDDKSDPSLKKAPRKTDVTAFR